MEHDIILEKALQELEEPVKIDEPIKKEENIEDALKNIIEKVVIEEDFSKIINDFTLDICTTFPEYQAIIDKWWIRDPTPEHSSIQNQYVFSHCLHMYPTKFFDIIYQKVEIFDKTSKENTEFLPNIIFKHLWNSDITEKTRKVIWKYLQLILFSVIQMVKKVNLPESTESIFQNINEEDMTGRLQETMESIKNMFDTESTQSEPSENTIHEHFQEMISGKIGKLAFEIAEETAGGLSMDEDITSTQDIFSNLLKDPSKLMNMVQSMGSKIDAKIKTGEINETEILNEGLEMLNKIKDIPGLGDITKMFSGLEGMMPKTKHQKGQVNTKINQNAKLTKMKERMNKKREMKKDPQLQQIDDLNKLISNGKPPIARS